ncbi:hypothetical protein [Streptosporangium saharense]|uniref:Uncharacterized protein n=1 Tax=Streptosporangium saharense TaxID=1706840 RepID=A0A7W7QVX0_9ACTN|nr:hypothetical protein [Streptosporangium saharense]MBB4920111.1 hypothetical protein [Streptosporangium saharense]
MNSTDRPGEVVISERPHPGDEVSDFGQFLLSASDWDDDAEFPRDRSLPRAVHLG